MTGAKHRSRLLSPHCLQFIGAMADIRPLRGVRFDPHHSGPVGPLLAPPYDVAAETTDGAEFSIRKVEAVDLGAGNDHAWAAERYRRWLNQGVLRRDPSPMVYIHRHQFIQNGAICLRTGLIARVRLADWSERIVLPHERTTAGPRNERLERLRAVRANLSPLYFLYRDSDGQVRDLIDSQPRSSPELHDRDQMGGAHELTPAADPDFQARLATAFAERTLFVADGHHRYEAALAFRNESRAAHGSDGEAPTEFVLALLAAVEDTGVIVRPTHRVIMGEPTIEPTSILEMLRQWFDVQSANFSKPMPEGDFVCRVVLSGDHGVWDLHAKPGTPHHALLSPGRGAGWRSLGIAAVEGIAERILRENPVVSELRAVPAIDDRDAIRQIRERRAQAAFLLPAPSLDRLLAVAEEGDLLPAKSTWFEPKAPAGLVINDLQR